MWSTSPGDLHGPAMPTVRQLRHYNRRLLSIFFILFYGIPGLALADPPSGVQPLYLLSGSKVHSLIDDRSVRPLLTTEEQEAFLIELDTQPPIWDQLHDPPGGEHGARLFELNRQRDELREGDPLLSQPIAFVWSGILGEYLPDRQGFKVVMGPEFTQTAWGLVRFKPMRLPDEMVAIASPTLLSAIRTHIETGKPMEIGILFIGTLTPWESIIYGFSHDGLEQGMVMPVVVVESVRYFLNTLPGP